VSRLIRRLLPAIVGYEGVASSREAVARRPLCGDPVRLRVEKAHPIC